MKQESLFGPTSVLGWEETLTPFIQLINEH